MGSESLSKERRNSEFQEAVPNSANSWSETRHYGAFHSSCFGGGNHQYTYEPDLAAKGRIRRRCLHSVEAMTHIAFSATSRVRRAALAVTSVVVLSVLSGVPANAATAGEPCSVAERGQLTGNLVCAILAPNVQRWVEVILPKLKTQQTTTTAAAANASSGPAVPVEWTTSANSLGLDKKPGFVVTVSCPARNGSVAGTVWGAGPYTTDSSICSAAVHAGTITEAKGGTFRITTGPGQEIYGASTRNGVTTNPTGAYRSSLLLL